MSPCSTVTAHRQAQGWQVFTPSQSVAQTLTFPYLLSHMSWYIAFLILSPSMSFSATGFPKSYLPDYHLCQTILNYTFCSLPNIRSHALTLTTLQLNGTCWSCSGSWFFQPPATKSPTGVPGWQIAASNSSANCQV